MSMLLTMPKYAVVICPDCRNPFIIEPGTKTVSCRHCNKRHETAKLRVFMATDDFKQAQAMRGSINAHICGDPAFDESMGAGLDDEIGQKIDGQRFKEDKARVDRKMREEARQTRARGQTATLIEVFEEMAAGGDVDIDEYWIRVSCCGITKKKFEIWVDKMIQTGVAYSPSYGCLRKG
jgi:LSD1 subclass zinc finger protein